jgi:hypothetical protein
MQPSDAENSTRRLLVSETKRVPNFTAGIPRSGAFATILTEIEQPNFTRDVPRSGAFATILTEIAEEAAPASDPVLVES